MTDVLLKKIDPKLYARLKARAASDGKSVSEAFNEAVRVWLAINRTKDEERGRNVEVYLKIKRSIPQHPNEYFVIAKGAYLGHFRSLSLAFRKLKENQATKALVVHYQPSGEWLGGSIES